MTAPLPPTDGMTPVGDRNGEQGPVQAMDLQAPLPDLSSMAAEAKSAGDAWSAGAATWADSPQGDGLEGYTLTGDHPSGADGDWPADVSFDHQGP